jgi:lipid-A-disaccharide synthase
MSLKIAISAGEVSGDRHLSRVVRELKAINPSCKIRGMAGNACEQAGARLEVNCYKEGSTMGFVEALRSLGKIRRAFKIMQKLLESWRPDVLLIVDYPEFNLRLAKHAKRLGIKVVYYIPPKIWVWRSGRIRRIKRYVDKVAAIFPFEENFYRNLGYSNICFVGHPVAEHAMPERIESETGAKRLLLMPGSRRFEVERIIVPALQAVEQLRNEGINLVPVILLAPTIERNWVVDLLRETVHSSVCEAIEWSTEEPLSVMASSHIGILKSGTCNLEAAIARLPFVCVYSGSWLAKVVVSLLIRLREFSPVNIIQPRTVPEVIQTTLSARDIAQEVSQMVEASAHQKVVTKLERVSELLYDAPIDSLSSGFVCNVSQRVSEIVQDVIKKKNASH